MRRFCLGGTALLLALAAAACGGSSSSTSSGTASASTAPKAGGSLTVFEWNGYSGDWPAGLDPATNINGAATQSQMNAIYGELFELGSKGRRCPPWTCSSRPRCSTCSSGCGPNPACPTCSSPTTWPWSSRSVTGLLGREVLPYVQS